VGDGARTDDSAGTCEWWYFDAHLADGAKLVVTFMNKEIAEPQKPLSPLLRVDATARMRRVGLWACSARGHPASRSCPGRGIGP
jgi:hypothetical protein